MPLDWYIEKKGKYYGPFKAEKVLSYAQTGKISAATLVARDDSGDRAQPFSEMEEQLKQEVRAAENGVKPQLQAEPKSQKQEAPPAENEVNPQLQAGPKAQGSEIYGNEDSDGGVQEWFICTPDRRFGPYSLSHLEELISEGKLQANDRLQREGQSHLLDVAELFPKKPEPPTPDKTTKSAEAQPKTKAHSLKTTTSSSPKKSVWLPALIILLFIGGCLVWLKPFSKKADSSNLLANFKRKIDQTSTLRSQVRHAELPPFNDLVQSALREGLNFHYQNLLNMRAQDQHLYSADGSERFGAWFKQEIRREVSYSLNGGYNYIYLLDYDDLVFAVFIQHGSFKRSKLSDVKQTDFAPNANESTEFGGIAWSTELVDGIEAKAIWGSDETGEVCLKYVCVLNQSAGRKN